MEVLLYSIFSITLGTVAFIIMGVIWNINRRKNQRKQYGFVWSRYSKEDFVHKYVGDFLYVCERVPYLNDKLDALPKEK